MQTEVIEVPLETTPKDSIYNARTSRTVRKAQLRRKNRDWSLLFSQMSRKRP
jgi:hypothetical protein